MLFLYSQKMCTKKFCAHRRIGAYSLPVVIEKLPLSQRRIRTKRQVRLRVFVFCTRLQYIPKGLCIIAGGFNHR